ncbi:hypothetical protein BJX64DRAFT_291819 [Aspergillus heterothallicus]
MASVTLRTHSDYSIGIVCAQPKEQTAAVVSLDERHDDLSKASPDDNEYTLGSINNHNVVIACHSKGFTGTSSAANIATQMLSSFPSIRFCLMIGIGGGVTPQVRLGDVVIGAPSNGLPGVVQWDMDRPDQCEGYRQTGRLNEPPKLLLTALCKLRSKHLTEEHSISRHLKDMFLKYPRLASTYDWRGSLDDACFQPDYVHIAAESTQPGFKMGNKRNHEGQIIDTGADCRLCDPAKSLRRPSRDMAVHYGLIASGRQVLEDATVRDRINGRLGGNVLCFEMEAAGLINSFPCVVIRGICDYCDSNKNENWQEHAAAVAAAFAKEMLEVIQLPQVSELPTATEVIKSLSNTVSQVTLGKGHGILAQTYDSAFMRIQNSLAKSLLALLVCCRRILTTDELLHALAVEPGTSGLDSKNFCNLEELVSCCDGLIVYDHEVETVRFVHTTAREYFQQRCSMYFPDGPERLATVCLTYLSYEAFKSGACPSEQAYVARKTTYPFLEYASRYWAEHYGDCEDAPEDLALHFLMDPMRVSAATQALVLPHFEYLPSRQSVPAGFTGAHLIAFFGLSNLVVPLSAKVCFDKSDSCLRTPLSYAAEMGHIATVRALTGTKVTLNKRDGSGATAMHYAAWKGHHKIVALLLKKGEDINSRDCGYGTPLTWAIDGGSIITLKFLLQRNASTEFLYSPFARYSNLGYAPQLSSLLWPWKTPAVWNYAALQLRQLEADSAFEDWDENPGEAAKLSPYRIERRIFLPPIFQQVACNGGRALKEDVRKELENFQRNDYLDALSDQGEAQPRISRKIADSDDDKALLKQPLVLDDIFFSPLLRAVWKRNHPAIQLLLSHGCSPYFGNSRGLTPSMLVDRMDDPITKGIFKA